MVESSNLTHVIIDRVDLECLSDLEIEFLAAIMKKINGYRFKRGASTDPKYYMCDITEPYAPIIEKVIEVGESMKHTE